jgi:hypothetical protein
MFEVCRTPPLLKQNETAILDCGCTGHFLCQHAMLEQSQISDSFDGMPPQWRHHGVLSYY